MQLLTRGNWQRTQESTATSKMSSRSHAVLQVTVHRRSHGTDVAEEVHIGRLSMVDLAGSELASQVPVLFISVTRLVSICPLVWERDPVCPCCTLSPAPRTAPGQGEVPTTRLLSE